MMNFRYLAIFFTLLCLSLTVFAANESNDKEQTTEKNNPSTSSPTSGPRAANKRSQVKTLEEFIPSEEVSADKPVAFPSDI